MRLVLRAVNAQRLKPVVCFEDFGDLEDADRLVADEQPDPFRGGHIVRPKDDRDGERRPAGQSAALDNGLVVITTHVRIDR